MDFNFDLNSIMAGIACSAIVYVFGGIFKLRIDVNRAFKKIREMEGKSGERNAKNINGSNVAPTND